VDAAHAAAGPGAPEEGKFLVDTASAVPLPLTPPTPPPCCRRSFRGVRRTLQYQNWETEKVLGSIFAADPELRAKISIHTKCNNGQLPHKSLSKVRDSSDALVLYRRC